LAAGRALADTGTSDESRKTVPATVTRYVFREARLTSRHSWYDPRVRTDLSASESERNRTRRLFDLALPLFPLVERWLLPQYRRALAAVDLPVPVKVLDIGTGTGALAQAFGEQGHQVTGIDFAERLIGRAKRRVPAARFEAMDLADLPRWPDLSFDLVSFGYVLHGLSPDLRLFVLRQADRIASRWVLICDYCCRGPWYVSLVERIEGPHYPAFVASPIEDLLAAAHLEVQRRVPMAPCSACWLCRRLAAGEA